MNRFTSSAWIALCMTAFLAAATQAPITSFVIVMEMINGHTLVVSLIATAFLSSMISRLFSKPLYQTLSYQVARNARAALSPPSVAEPELQTKAQLP